MLPNNRDYQPVRTLAGSQAIASFMARVYLWMVVGIAMSGITAFVVASQPNIMAYVVQNSFVFFGLIIFQLVAVVALSGWVQRMSIGMAATVYALYATLVGVTFSVLLLAYTAESVTSAFFLTAFAFSGLSAYGYLTKRDLGPIGSFCIMGLFGLIGIMFLGIFIPKMMGNGMQLAIAVAGLLIFSGLTAYDTQRIKAFQSQFVNPEEARKGAILGALILYLDFINLFINILRLMGNRR